MVPRYPPFKEHGMRGLILGLAALMVTSPFAQAAGDIAIGRTVMEKCQGCHGKDGLGGQPFIPNIAGQKEFYFIQSVMAYKAGDRKSQSMSDALKGLSDEDIANVAAYYSAIKLTVKVPQ
jgi:cytochrome c553